MGFAALNPSYSGSPRRQHGKVLARIALRQRLWARLGHVGGIDMGARRPAAARLDHALDHGSRPGEHGFDTAVAAIADPALDAMQKCIVLDPDPEADALHAAAHRHAADTRHAHPTSPTS